MAEKGKVGFDVLLGERIPSNCCLEMPSGPSKGLLREPDHTHHWPQRHVETQAHKAQEAHRHRKGHFVPPSRKISLCQMGSAGDGKLSWKTTLQH